MLGPIAENRAPGLRGHVANRYSPRHRLSETPTAESGSHASVWQHGQSRNGDGGKSL